MNTTGYVGMLAGAVGAMLVVLIGVVVTALTGRERYQFLIPGAALVVLLVIVLINWKDWQ